MEQKTSNAICIIRIIAMFYVAIGNHYLPLYFSGLLSTAISQFLGCIGVGAFFAVSGYLFGTKAKLDESIGTSKWLKKRLRRIMIPYWCVLLVVISIRVIKGESISLLSVLISVLNLQGIIQLRFAFPELGHTWFISIIAVCYLLTMLWVRVKDNRRFWNIHWLIYGAVIVGFSLLGQVTSSIYTAYVLLFSIMFYIGNKDYFKETIRVGQNAIIACCVIVTALLTRMLCWKLLDATWIYTIVVCVSTIFESIAYFYFMVSVIPKIVQKKYPMSIAKCFDSISYEFYLIHALLISGATSIVGILGKSLFEMIVLLLIATLLSKGLHWICRKINRKV